MVSLPDLAQRLIEAGIIQKSFQECTRKDIELICEAVFSSISGDVPPDGWTAPVIDDGKLRITFNSHPKYHWWTTEGQSITETLEELMADYSVAKRYIPFITEEEWVNRLIPF